MTTSFGSVLSLAILFLSLTACGGSPSVGSENTETDPPVTETPPSDETPNDPVAPILSIANSASYEGNSGTTSQLNFTLNLDKPSSSEITTRFNTEDMTATAGTSDYAQVEGQLTFNPGETTKQISVFLYGDDRFEGSETITLGLSDTSDNVTLDRSQATGIILDDDIATTDSSLPELPGGIISTSAAQKPVPQAILDNPFLTGFMVIDDWSHIEPSEGVFDWSHIDSEIERARTADKVIRMSIHTGGDSVPDWVFENYPDITRIISYDKATNEQLWIASFWDPAFIELKNRLYQALGERYNNEPVVFAMSASMIDPHTGDWTFEVETEAQIQSYYDAGFTEETFKNAYKTLIDNAMTAFENKYVVSAAGHIPSPLSSDKLGAIFEVLDYAYTTYGNQLQIARGSLNANIPDIVNLPANHPWQSMVRYSPNAIGQFVWSASNDPNYQMNGKVPYDESEINTVFLNTIEKGERYNLHWIEVWIADLVNEDLQAEVEYAATLFNQDQ